MSGASGAVHAPPRAELERLGRRAFVTAAAGTAACLVGLLFDPERALLSWLIACLLFLGLGLGCLGLGLLHALTGGAWGVVSRRVFEASSRTLPALSLLTLPVLAFHARLTPWSSEGAPWFQAPFLAARGLLYLAVWCLLARQLGRTSERCDRLPDPERSRRLQSLGAGGLIAFFLTVSLASIDWLMSLQPHWYSHVYGLYLIGGEAVAGLALTIVVLRLLSRHGELKDVLLPRHWQDLGNLLFACVILWAYLGFSQLLIIWSGDLPDEISFYLDRTRGPWLAAGFALALFHFFLPFAVLLSRDVKRRAHRLFRVAVLLLVLRWVDLWYQAVPAARPGSPWHWLDLAALLAVGGVWLGVFAAQLGRVPILPESDPRLQEVLSDA